MSVSGQSTLLLVLLASVVCYRHFNASLWEHFEKVGEGDIGRGTFGVCYLVRPLHAAGPVLAAKMVKARPDQPPMSGIPEVRTQNHVSSPFVPKIHSSFWDETASQLALVMDYGGPVSLQALERRIAVKTFRSDRSELAVFVAANLVHALGDVHSAGVFHRDLMPYNMVVSEDGYISIVDFGNAIANATKKQMDVDTERLCRIVYRYLMHAPDRIGLPDLQMVRNHVNGLRHRQLLNATTTISDFLKHCVALPKVESLRAHPVFGRIDWHALGSRQLESPLQQIVAETMQGRRLPRPGLQCC